MSDLCIIGLDPGISGAVAFYFPSHPQGVAVQDVPVVNGQVDPYALSTLIENYKPGAAVIEQVGARPGQGVSSMFKFGTAYGLAWGVIAAAKTPIHFVPPTKWKRHFRLGKEKDEARALAIRTWPRNAGVFSRVKDHGRAEAALLARYGADTAFANIVARCDDKEGLFA